MNNEKHCSIPHRKIYSTYLCHSQKQPHQHAQCPIDPHNLHRGPTWLARTIDETRQWNFNWTDTPRWKGREDDCLLLIEANARSEPLGVWEDGKEHKSRRKKLLAFVIVLITSFFEIGFVHRFCQRLDSVRRDALNCHLLFVTIDCG